MKSRIAIVGGNGFIGKNLKTYLANMDYHIKVINRGMCTTSERNISYLNLDIRDPEALLEAVRDVQTVIWLVHTSVPSKADTLDVDFENNISPVVNLLEGVRDFPDLKQFIYFSSGGTVYGDIADHHPVDESYPQNPISSYGFSKSIIEKYIIFLTRNHSFESIILRPSNIFGPHQNMQKPQGIIGYALDAIISGKTLDLYDGGIMIRDFIYIDDVSEAVAKCIASETKHGETSVYNLGSGKGYSIKEVISVIEEVSGRHLGLINRTSRNFDCQYNVLDFSKLSKDKKWLPQTSLKDGIKYVYDWFVKNRSK